MNWLPRRRLQNVVVFSRTNTSPARVSSLTSFGPMFIKPAPSCCLMFYAIYLLQQCCAPIVKNVWLSKVKKFSATFQRGLVGWFIQWRRITACSNDGMVLSERLSGCSSWLCGPHSLPLFLSPYLFQKKEKKETFQITHFASALFNHFAVALLT